MKDNQKGFTLIEVLAVIIILGLLSGLIVFYVRPSIDDSKSSVNDASVDILVKSLENYYFEAKLKGDFNGCSYDFTNNSNTCTGFSFSGEKPSEGVISLDLDGFINGNLVFGKNSYSIVRNKVR